MASMDVSSQVQVVVASSSLPQAAAIVLSFSTETKVDITG